MIQVLDRMDKILEIVANGDGVGLKEISTSVSLNKTTAFNILKSLGELGFVSQGPDGGYALGERLLSLSQTVLSERTLGGMAHEFAKELSLETHESGLVAVLKRNELIVIAKHIFDQGVIINTSVYSHMPKEKNASARLFIAYLDDNAREEFLKTCFLDMNISERKKQLKSIKEDIKAVRQRGIAIQPVYGREAYALAVPVFDQNGKIRATLGLNLPAMRFDSKRETELEATMKRIAARMEDSLGLALANS